MAGDFDHNNANYLERSSTSFGLNGLTEMSVAAWVNIDNLDASTTPRVCSKELTAAAQQTFDFFVGATSATTLDVRLENPDITENPNWVLNTGIGLDTWARVLFTWKRNAGDGTDGLMYVNGSSAAVTFSGTYTTGFVLKELSDIYTIGNNKAHNRAFDGLIAWVNIWNRQLTSGEATKDYIDPLSVTSGLISSVAVKPNQDIIFGGSMTETGTVGSIKAPRAPLGRLLGHERHRFIHPHMR